MRTGWTDKEASEILEVRPRKVSQALVPAYRKVARLWRVDPTRTLRDILDTIDDLEPMTENEIDFLERLHAGRADRAELGQPPARRR